MQARRTAWRPHNPFTVTILTQIHIQWTCTYPASQFTKNISHQQVFYLQDDASDASPNILPGDIPNGKFPLYLAFVQFYMVKIHRNNGFRWNVWWPGSPRLSGRAYRSMPNVTDALTPLLTLITFRPNMTKHTVTQIKNLGLETANHSYRKAEIFSRTLKDTYQVNNNIFAPFWAPFRGNFTDVHHGFWIVRIHVENRSIDDTRHICAVRWWARWTWISCEANLNTHVTRTTSSKTATLIFCTH